MYLIGLFLTCQCCITSLHDIHNQIWQKIYGFYLNKKLWSSLPWRPGRNYAVVLCNDFMGNLLVLFWTKCQSVIGPCDIKYFKISTAYDVWFSRHRPSNMKLVTDSALVLVFINFLWAVYIHLRENLNQRIMPLITFSTVTVSTERNVESCFN